MKIYKIKFNDGYTKKTYLVAETTLARAVLIAFRAESGIHDDGTIITPSIDYFYTEVIDGLYSRVAGIKSIIY